MTTQKWNEVDAARSADPLDGPLTAALEAVPHVAVDEGFAARVMSRLPVPKTAANRLSARASIGQRVSLGAVAVLFVAMMAFAAQSGEPNTSTRMVAESIFALEFATLIAWLSLRQSRSQ